jgi:hypothetical protein
MTRSCTRRYSPSLSCSRLLGVAPTMMTPHVAETETHLMSPSLQFFHIFSVVLHTCHVPLMSCGVFASDLTCSQPRLSPNSSRLPTYQVGPSAPCANQSMWLVSLSFRKAGRPFLVLPVLPHRTVQGEMGPHGGSGGW